MNRQQFSEFVRNPGLTNDQSLKLLEDLVKRFPSCQSGQILFAWNLLSENDLQYHTQLKKAAAYAGDRKRLKELLYKPEHLAVAVEVKVEVQPSVVIEEKQETDEQTPVDYIVSSGAITEEELLVLPELKVLVRENLPEVPAYSRERLTREELLYIVRKRLSEIRADDCGNVREQENPAIPKNDLIDKFILEEPRISPPKTAFFNPTDTSLRSNMDEEEIISETLARLYANQGNIQKAIHIYQKLSLLNQEKSRYFAAQIETLKS